MINKTELKTERSPMLFQVCVSQTLSKNNVDVLTSDYKVLNEKTKDGIGHTYINTENTDFKEAYGKKHMTPYGLISVLGVFCRQLLEEGRSTYSGYTLEELAWECREWNIDEEIIMEEKKWD